MTNYFPDLWSCNTCGKDKAYVNKQGDCSSCAQIHNAVPMPPNATCSHCNEEVYLLDDQSSYWCWDCGTAYPREDARPIEN